MSRSFLQFQILRMMSSVVEQVKCSAKNAGTQWEMWVSTRTPSSVFWSVSVWSWSTVQGMVSPKNAGNKLPSWCPRWPRVTLRGGFKEKNTLNAKFGLSLIAWQKCLWQFIIKGSIEEKLQTMISNYHLFTYVSYNEEKKWNHVLNCCNRLSIKCLTTKSASYIVLFVFWKLSAFDYYTIIYNKFYQWILLSSAEYKEMQFSLIKNKNKLIVWCKL